MYSPLAHDGGVAGLTYSDSYVITLGADDKLRTWDRFQGHLLMTIIVVSTYIYKISFLITIIYIGCIMYIISHLCAD